MYRKLILGLGVCLAAITVFFTSSAFAKGGTAATPRQAAAALCPAPCKVQATDTGGTNNVFTPVTVTVKPGEAITWDNTGSAAHTATADDGQTITFDSQNLNAGQSYTWSGTTTPGYYLYHCTYHAALGMVGAIVVTNPDGSLPPPPSPKPTVQTTTDALPTPAPALSHPPSQKYFPKVGGALVVLLLVGISFGYLKTKQKLADKS